VDHGLDIILIGAPYIAGDENPVSVLSQGAACRGRIRRLGTDKLYEDTQ